MPAVSDAVVLGSSILAAVAGIFRAYLFYWFRPKVGIWNLESPNWNRRRPPYVKIRRRKIIVKKKILSKLEGIHRAYNRFTQKTPKKLRKIFLVFQMCEEYFEKKKIWSNVGI